jgi:hypothetical protein
MTLSGQAASPVARAGELFGRVVGLDTSVAFLEPLPLASIDVMK